MDDYNQKLAELAVKYSLQVRPQQKIFISGSELAAPLMQSFYKEILSNGAYPYCHIDLSGLDEILLKYGTIEQLEYVSPVENTLMEQFDGRIYILTENNMRKFEQIPENRIMRYMGAPNRARTRTIRETRVAEGKFQWTVVPYPCEAFAQNAGMDLISFREFAYKALKFTTPDPIAAWNEFKQTQQKKIKTLQGVKSIQLLGEDTNLSLSVEGRPWLDASGQRNLPDGEIYTCPVEDSLNGHIRFSYPGIFQGKEIENIFLEFRNGKVVSATAEKGEKLLSSLLQLEGACYAGEFAIGTNYDITQFVKHILFDEKIGGTIHIALGNSYKEAGGKNISPIHWDLIKNMQSAEAQIFADDSLIYQAGTWKI